MFGRECLLQDFSAFLIAFLGKKKNVMEAAKLKPIIINSSSSDNNDSSSSDNNSNDNDCSNDSSSNKNNNSNDKVSISCKMFEPQLRVKEYDKSELYTKGSLNKSTCYGENSSLAV